MMTSGTVPSIQLRTTGVLFTLATCGRLLHILIVLAQAEAPPGGLALLE